VEEGVAAILGGQVVEVQDHQTVYYIIDRLQKLAKEIKALGKKSPTYDLCNVLVKGTNIFCAEQMKTKRFPNGIPRLQMPQIGGHPVPGSRAESFPRNPWDPTEVDGSQDFIRFTEEHGLKVTSGMTSALQLRPSQRELVGPKVAAMVVDKNFDAVKNPLFISKDNYVIDGHHRWAAVVARDMETQKLQDIQMKTLRVDAPMSEVYFLAMRWAKTAGLMASKGVTASEERLARGYWFHEEYAQDDRHDHFNPNHVPSGEHGGEFAPAGGDRAELERARNARIRAAKRAEQEKSRPLPGDWTSAVIGSAPSKKPNITAGDEKRLPEPGYLRLAQQFRATGEIAIAHEDERTHHDVMQRLLDAKHPGMLKEDEPVPDVALGWVDSKGTFYDREWLLEQPLSWPSWFGGTDTWGHNTIKMPKPRKKFSFPNHKGRPGQRGGSLPRGESDEEVDQLGDTAAKTGGFTYNPVRYKDRTPPKRGFALSIRKDTEKVVKLDQTHAKIRAQLKDYIHAHREDIKAEGNYLGGWIDKGKLYVDISRVVKKKDEAIDLAREAKQLAVFDLGKGQTIEVPKAA
jgi:hypothetical protein